MTCNTSDTCPSALDAGSGAASLCSGGVCTQCATNTDCPAALPACALIPAQYASFRQCVECALDSDCPTTSPRCVGHACVKCATSADCALGVCSSGACVPGCSAQAPCANPLTACSAAERCDPIPCSDSSSCPVNSTCAGGQCTRKACSADAQCSGYCVNQQCFDSLGTCHAQIYYQ